MRRRRGPRALLPLLLLLLFLHQKLGSASSWAGASENSEWGCQHVAACKCIWSSGRRTAECKHQDLHVIPDSLSKEIQHLDLTDNTIAYLPDSAFADVDLVNLQKLTMRECQVKSVGQRAFSGLRIIIEIDLSSNKIRQLQRGTFNDTERLRVLLLNDNKLARLDDDLFLGLTFLQKVELSNNHIHQIGQRSFHNLPGLTTLALDGNNLTRLSPRSFEAGLPKLGSLELSRNPWHCDCQLAPFRAWAFNHNLYTKPTACAEPQSLHNRHWDEVQNDEFACAPRIELVGALQRGDVGVGSAQLWCRVSAEPAAHIEWVHRQRVVGNDTKRPASERGYVLSRSEGWANLTIPEVGIPDKGDYVCSARNFGGSVERSLGLAVMGEGPERRDGFAGLPLAVGLGLVAFLFMFVALVLCLWYCRRRRSDHDEKNAEPASLDHHGLGEQEKSLITAINPVVKPPRRYEAPSVNSHGTEMTELNRTLLENDSIFADGVGSVMGVLANGLNDEEKGRLSPDSLINRTSHLDGVVVGPSMSPGSLAANDNPSPSLGANGSNINKNNSHNHPNASGGTGLSLGHHGGSVTSGIGTLSRNTTPYRQYPPDLLAFSGGRNSSPTSQASTAPDSSRLTSHQHQQPLYQHHHHDQQQQQHYQPTVVRPLALFGSPSSPAASSFLGYSPTAAFKTLPHPPRSSSVTPYSYSHPSPHHFAHLGVGIGSSRYGGGGSVGGGYGTIPRRPRAPSWSSCPPTSPTERDLIEPVYDNLGERKTADGCSVASLNLRTPEPRHSMRNRPLPATPDCTSPSSSSAVPSSSGSARAALFTLPRVPRASPQQLQPPMANRSAPEGASEWLLKITDEQQQKQRFQEAKNKQEKKEEEVEQEEKEITKEKEEEVEEQQRGDEDQNLSAAEKQQQEQKQDTSETNSASQQGSTLTRKVPPRPPPKPKKKNGPVYEDEGEDGTEV